MLSVRVTGVPSTSVAASMTAIVLGDRPRLRQLFYILIENAIRYSDHEVHIALDITRTEDWIRTQVCDNGFGMSEMDLENAFDHFYRGDGAQQIFSDGSGLGLPVAKSIVEAHKGEIFIQSTQSGGHHKEMIGFQSVIAF